MIKIIYLFSNLNFIYLYKYIFVFIFIFYLKNVDLNSGILRVLSFSFLAKKSNNENLKLGILFFSWILICSNFSFKVSHFILLISSSSLEAHSKKEGILIFEKSIFSFSECCRIKSTMALSLIYLFVFFLNFFLVFLPFLLFYKLIKYILKFKFKYKYIFLYKKN